MVVADESATVFAERLTPSPTAWLLAPGVGAIFFVMFLPANVTAAIGAGIVSAALTALWLWSLAARVELTTTHLRVGRAEIEIGALGEASACSPDEVTFHMGPGSDARSFVLTRPWVRTGVYVEQQDPRDPTPYWLFSSRRGEEFVHALRSLREA